jgi:hypothetical protein
MALTATKTAPQPVGGFSLFSAFFLFRGDFLVSWQRRIRYLESRFALVRIWEGLGEALPWMAKEPCYEPRCFGAESGLSTGHRGFHAIPGNAAFLRIGMIPPLPPLQISLTFTRFFFVPSGPHEGAVKRYRFQSAVLSSLVTAFP